VSREVARPWSRLLGGQSDQYGVSREAQYAIDVEAGRGLVQVARDQADIHHTATKIAGVGYVTHLAVGEAASAFESATQHSRRMPHAAPDLLGLARTGTAVMDYEIRKLGLKP
jgi:hypothetical protein